jgi:hypothetical protein
MCAVNLALACSSNPIAMVELMQKGNQVSLNSCRILFICNLSYAYTDSSLPCFAAFGEQTAVQLRDRFQPTLTHSLVGDYVDKLIDTSLGSNWTRLYDLVGDLYDRCMVLDTHTCFFSTNTIRNLFCDTCTTLAINDNDGNGDVVLYIALLVVDDGWILYCLYRDFSFFA